MGNEYGFITAAHCAPVGQYVEYNGKEFGIVTHANYGKQSDVAFIKRLNNDWKSTTYFTDGSFYDSGKDLVYGARYVTGGFPVGTIVYNHGFQTKGKEGVIASRSYTRTNVVGETVTNLVLADYLCVSGDSGGPIRVIKVYNGKTYHYCAGIHNGIVSRNGVNYGYYSDIDYAMGNLGFVGYYDINTFQ